MAFLTLDALSVRDRCDASGRACQLMAKPDEDEISMREMPAEMRNAEKPADPARRDHCLLYTSDAADDM
eukprot:12086824-Prorocentrum_lima.AAC.1